MARLCAGQAQAHKQKVDIVSQQYRPFSLLILIGQNRLPKKFTCVIFKILYNLDKFTEFQ